MTLETTVGLARIAIGLMFGVKLYYTVRARQLVWSHRVPEWRGRSLLAPGLLVLCTANAAFTLGAGTDLAALVQWAAYVFLFRYASLYGLEDISFHTITFYFVFAGSGAAWSLDAALGISLWGRLPAGSVVPELWLASAAGLIFLSAGVTKLPSAMWRRGLGAYYFFLLPNYRRLDTSLLTGREWLARALNWGALVMELGLLPVLLVNSVPLGLVFWAMAIGFTLLLSTVFVLTWIGESLSVAFLIVLWLLVDSGGQGLGARWLDALAGLDAASAALAAFLILTLAGGLVTALFAHEDWLPDRFGLRAAYRRARTLTRFTWGLIPCEVFTEVHMRGPIVYRSFAVSSDGSEHELFRIFGARACPGPARNLRPAFFEVTSYKVAEACMELDRHGAVVTPARERFVCALAEHVRGVAPRALRGLTRLRFRVLQVVPPGGFAGTARDYLEAPWVDAFDVTFENGRALAIERRAERILGSDTGRDLARLSFEFDPASR